MFELVIDHILLDADFEPTGHSIRWVYASYVDADSCIAAAKTEEVREQIDERIGTVNQIIWNTEAWEPDHIVWAIGCSGEGEAGA